MIIRPESPSDVAAVRAVNLAAFETSAEADLVDRLREQGAAAVSLIAEEAGMVVGHILFSPVTLSGRDDLERVDPKHADVQILGLAPMAVLPERQRSGIGSALVRAGLEQCRRQGCAAVVVLGHSAYYPRFGFLPAARFGIDSEYDVPDDVFMALELEPGALGGKSGMVRYHAAFEGV